MLKSKIENFDIIDKSIYNSNTSLKQDIITSIRKDDVLSDEDIINIIVKYFISYIYPNKINSKISLEEINKIFSITNFFFKISRTPWTIVNWLNEDDLKLLNFIQNNWYSLSMLWDIAATVELFKEIANKEISPRKFNNKYLWIDLWSWSWILLLAQFMQAARNWFKDIKNFWVEISESVYHTKIMTSNILFWDIILWNSTEKNTYDFFKNFEQDITHISNETIPTNWISFWHYIINGTIENPDPFIENNKALFWNINDYISEATIFFPEKVRIVLTSDPRELENSRNIVIWKRENKFWIDTFSEIESDIKKQDWYWNFNINTYLFPTWIEIWWEIVWQEQIWKKIIDSWKVKKLPDWRDRWNSISY